jgi:nucleoid-associated protein YgaU
LKDNNTSPDRTHVRSVVAGDRLPLMAHRIYRTPNHYLAVARANKLYGFRRLAEGTRISFPPIDRKAK